MAKYTVFSAPATEPISLTEAKLHLIVDHSDDDDLIDIIIKAAREYCEKYTDRLLMTQTIDEYFEEFPSSTDCNPRGGLTLRFAPTVSSIKLTYYNENNTLVTLEDITEESLPSGDLLALDVATVPNVLNPPIDGTWPDTYNRHDAIKLQYVAGYASAALVPAPIRQAMLLIIGKMYEQREDSVKKMPTHAQWLLDPFRIPHI